MTASRPLAPESRRGELPRVVSRRLYPSTRTLRRSPSRSSTATGPSSATDRASPFATTAPGRSATPPPARQSPPWRRARPSDAPPAHAGSRGAMCGARSRNIARRARFSRAPIRPSGAPRVRHAVPCDSVRRFARGVASAQVRSRSSRWRDLDGGHEIPSGANRSRWSYGACPRACSSCRERDRARRQWL